MAVTARYSVEGGGHVQSLHVGTYPEMLVSTYAPITTVETRLKAERGLGASMVMLYWYHSLYRQHTQEGVTENERLIDKRV